MDEEVSGSSVCWRARARRARLGWSGAASSGLGGRGRGRGFEEGGGGEAVVPLGVLDELFGGEGAGGVVFGEDEGAEEDALGLAGGLGAWERTLSMRWAAACLSSWRRMAESMPSFCAASAANSSRWMRLGMRRMWGRRKFRALTLASAVRRGEELAGAVDEVVGVALGGAEGGHVGLDAVLADEAVGVEAAFEGDDFDVEVLFGEQGDGFFGGVGAGGVGVEVDDDALGEAAEQADLHLGEGGAGGGEDVVDAGHVDGDAVHLAFDEEGEVVGAHVGLGLVEVEEDVALGVERRSRAS